MNLLRLALGLCVVYSVAGAADSGAGSLPPDAQKVVDGYAADVAKLYLSYHDKAVQANDKPTAELKKLQAKYAAANKLDEALLIKGLIDRLGNGELLTEIEAKAKGGTGDLLGIGAQGGTKIVGKWQKSDGYQIHWTFADDKTVGISGAHAGNQGGATGKWDVVAINPKPKIKVTWDRSDMKPEIVTFLSENSISSSAGWVANREKEKE